MPRKPKPKKTEWICPFVILTDDREVTGGRPYTFKGMISDYREGKLPIIVDTYVERMKTGDYSIVSFQHLITVERKAPEDLIKTLTRGRDNFYEELDRMKSFEQAVIVVEADWKHVHELVGFISRANAKSIARTVMAIQQDYRNVQWAFLPDRTWAERYTFQFLKRFYQRKVDNEKEIQSQPTSV